MQSGPCCLCGTTACHLLGRSVDQVSTQLPSSNNSRYPPTLLEMILEACTVMLYNAVATVRVRTEPAFLDVMATMIAWTYGAPIRSTKITHRPQVLASAGRTSSAISKTKHHTSVTTPRRIRWLNRSETHVQNSKLRMNRTYAGMVSRFVSNVPNPRLLSCSVM